MKQHLMEKVQGVLMMTLLEIFEFDNSLSSNITILKKNFKF